MRGCEVCRRGLEGCGWVWGVYVAMQVGMGVGLGVWVGGCRGMWGSVAGCGGWGCVGIGGRMWGLRRGCHTSAPSPPVAHSPQHLQHQPARPRSLQCCLTLSLCGKGPGPTQPNPAQHGQIVCLWTGAGWMASRPMAPVQRHALMGGPGQAHSPWGSGSHRAMAQPHGHASWPDLMETRPDTTRPGQLACAFGQKLYIPELHVLVLSKGVLVGHAELSQAKPILFLSSGSTAVGMAQCRRLCTTVWGMHMAPQAPWQTPHITLTRLNLKDKPGRVCIVILW